jgi:O-antigen/teichoic acid export membrane protein
MFLPARLLRRIRPSLTAGLNSLIVPLLTPIVSIAVVRLASPELWGQFVPVLIAVQLASHVASWGGRDYLVRAFSQSPARIASEWQVALLARLGLLLLCMLPLLLLGWPIPVLATALLWLLGMVFAQAHDSLITYTKAFGSAALIEILATLMLAGGVVLLGSQLTLPVLVGLHAALTIIKALALALRFRRWIFTRIVLHWRDSWRFLRGALPFFLLGLSGMLQSRVDLYCASLLLGTIELAHYQVLVTLIGYLQALPNLALLPLIRALYRLGPEATPRLAGRMLLAGLVGIPALVGLGGWLIAVVYQFELPLLALLGAALAAIPICWYLPQIYALYRIGQQQRVVWVNSAGILASLAGSLLLIPSLGVAGGALAAATSQWLMLAMYWYHRRQHNP